MREDLLKAISHYVSSYVKSFKFSVRYTTYTIGTNIIDQSVASLSLLLQNDGPQNSNAVASPSVSVETVSSDSKPLKVLG